jgi:hypothetical protein
MAVLSKSTTTNSANWFYMHTGELVVVLSPMLAHSRSFPRFNQMPTLFHLEKLGLLMARGLKTRVFPWRSLRSSCKLLLEGKSSDDLSFLYSASGYVPLTARH